MRALTIHQPYAELIARGFKTFETRSWGTVHRGPLAIHAGKKWNAELRAAADKMFDLAGIPPRLEILDVGVVIAVAELVAIHNTNEWRPEPDQLPYGDFGPDRFAWELADVRRLEEPVEARGMQGLWEWER